MAIEITPEIQSGKASVVWVGSISANTRRDRECVYRLVIVARPHHRVEYDDLTCTVEELHRDALGQAAWRRAPEAEDLVLRAALADYIKQHTGKIV